MNERVVRNVPEAASINTKKLLQAEPEPLEIDIQKTAIMVIDMQNTFVCKGGLFDQRGLDVSVFEETIKTINKLTTAARSKDIKVIYIVHRMSADLRETGGPDTGYWHKMKGPFALERGDTGTRNDLNIRGTWGAEIAKGLELQEGDIVVEKPKYSAFYGTDLDTVLKTFNIKYIAFVGTATNICVEASLRDALNLGYFCILVSDATIARTPFMQEATINNVKYVYGWVTSSENMMKAFKD